MSARLLVSPGRVESLQKFFSEKVIDVELVTDGEAAVTLQESAERQQCSDNDMFHGGWVTCETAWTLADKLSVNKLNFGATLDHLDIKMRNCQLGCF